MIFFSDVILWLMSWLIIWIFELRAGIFCVAMDWLNYCIVLWEKATNRSVANIHWVDWKIMHWLYFIFLNIRSITHQLILEWLSLLNHFWVSCKWAFRIWTHIFRLFVYLGELQFQHFVYLFYILFAKNFNPIVAKRIDNLFQNFIKLIEFLDVLFEELSILRIMLNSLFAPLFTYPALTAVFPDISMLNFVTAKDPCEYDFLHITSHWIILQHVIGYLVDSHEL